MVWASSTSTSSAQVDGQSCGQADARRSGRRGAFICGQLAHTRHDLQQPSGSPVFVLAVQVAPERLQPDLVTKFARVRRNCNLTLLRLAVASSPASRSRSGRWASVLQEDLSNVVTISS